MKQFFIKSIMHRTDGINQVTDEARSDFGKALKTMYDAASTIAGANNATDGVVIILDENLNVVKREEITATQYQPPAVTE